MHSSMMRTARSRSRPGEGGSPEQTPQEQTPREQTHTPLPQDQTPAINRITDACENITLPQLRCGR